MRRFGRLSASERQKITQVADPALVEMLIRYRSNDERTKISLERSLEHAAAPGTLRICTFECRSPTKSQCERKFVRQFRVMCLSQPLLYIHEQHLRDAETLLSQLDVISTQQIFQYGSKQLQPTGNPLWFSNLAFNTLGEWLCDSLERTILEGYYNRAQDQLSPPRHSLQYGRELMAFYDRLEYPKKLNILTDQVRTLLPEHLGLGVVLQLLPESVTLQSLGVLSHHVGLLEDYYNFQKSRLFVIEAEEKKPKKKPSHNRKRKRNNNAGSSNSSKTQASDQLSQSNTEKPEEDITRIDGEEKDNLQTSSSSSEEVIQLQSIPISEYDSEGQPASCTSIASEELPKETAEQQTGVCNRPGEQTQSLVPAEEGEQNSPDSQTKEIDKSQSTEEIPEEPSQYRKRKNKRKKKIPEQLVEGLFNMFLDSNLLRFVDGLSIESNSLLEARVIVFERIRYFVMKLYGEYTVDAKLFGSNAAGLALPTSDIDILMTGFSLDTQEESVSLLDNLSSQLKRMRWVVSCETYLHAKVPIIKLQIDPCVGFLQMAAKDDDIAALHQIREPLQLKSRIDSLIKVDITVEAKKADYSHLGCMSTEFMKSWLQAIPNLNPIMIVLKYLMSQKGLNRPFKGGLSSYCLMIMVTAYLKESIQHFKLAGKPPKSVGEQFIEVLNFYCEQFEAEKTSLSLLSNQSCFFKTGEQKFNINIVDPLNYRVMTANCSEYPRIKSEFRRIRDRLLAIPELMIADLQQVPTNDIKNMQLKKKLAEKWVKRYDSQQSVQIGNIIRGCE